MVSVITTGLGAAAIEAAGRVIDQTRSDPLAPALVVCSGPLVALGVRRALGRRSGGVAGVEVTTLDRLVEDLAGPQLAGIGHRVASSIEIQAAIRAELAAHPGLFGRVADHHTTEERLVALHRQLDGLDDEVLERMYHSGAGLANDAVRVVRAVNGRTGQAETRQRLLHRALDELAALVPFARGPLVLFLPEPQRPFEGRLVAALAHRPDCTVLVGLTGEPTIDRRHLDRLAVWGIQIEGVAAGPVNQAAVLEVADPDDEVRAAIRDAVAHAALGLPLNSMAVLYTAVDPYASLLHEQLDSAGLPWCGPNHRPLSVSVTGRFLLRLLELAATGLERSAVITLLSAGPVVDSTGRIVPASAWDRLSRQAGIIEHAHWLPRLHDLASHLEEAPAAQVHALSRFVGELADRLWPRPEPSSWAGWGSWASGLLTRYLAPDGGWPVEERAARISVLEALDQLAVLEALHPRPNLTGFASLVSAQLERRRMQGRPLGTGLLVAPITAVAGMGFERVAVVGMAEGVFPRVPREDSLLPDRLRSEARGLLAPSDAPGDLDIRAVAAVLASSRQTPLLLTARGDLRSIRSRSWPRVLNPLVGSRSVLESHRRGLADHGRPASCPDLGLRDLLAHVEGGDPVNTHELANRDPVLSANLTRILNRRRGELSQHTGRVAAGVIDATEWLLSATALETYASCPRKYLYERVLRLADHERPERIDEITPLDRGTLTHAVLERFIAESLAADVVPTPGEPWSPERRDHLITVLGQELTEAQARGLTGGRVNTLILERRLVAEMEQFLLTDDEMRAVRRSTPWHVELAFGFDDDQTVLELPDGRLIKLRGRVDRVDATEDGGLLVIDYKGGSGRAFDGISADPLKRGRRLQLPLYARVVAEKLGSDGPRTALYWLTSRGDLKPIELEANLEAELMRMVTAALDGISAGLFPGVPGEAIGWPRLSYENCRYCDFDRICPGDRQREWDNVRHDPALAPVEVLLRSAPVAP
jgi:ATP-dependent helicase/nuclease subunit B